MVILFGIAFLAGVITAISPCVLPVLPILLAGGASGGKRRPYAIIAGLITTFVLATLFAAWLLTQLHLRQDRLRQLGIVLLFVVAATLIVPRFGQLLERPLQRLTRRRGGDLGGGFLLGASLGVVFVPCGGPILGFIGAEAASLDFGAKTVFLTVFYALGAALPMTLIALGGQRAAGRVKAFRNRSVHVGLGVVMAAAALAITFNVDRKLQTRLSDYTNFFQKHTEKTTYAKKKLGLVKNTRSGGSGLQDLGAAPNFTGIKGWLNTPGGRPLALRDLRGKVVVVDFWTYSCINCLRTLPHLRAWYASYKKAGLVIVGVHTPEFAFERVASNVRRATMKLGVRYPVALDNDYGTWNAYGNFAWPTKYLIDRRGHVRFVHEGEGDYDKIERLIRRLLGERAPGQLASVADQTPTHFVTPESYLGYQRLQRYAGSEIVRDRSVPYVLPRDEPPQNTLAYGGYWRVEQERIVAGRRASLQLHFLAQDVHLVLGGRGTLQVLVNGKRARTIRVAGISRLYTLLRFRNVEEALLELRFSPGLAAYAFTFG